MRGGLFTIAVLFLVTACTLEPALDLEGLEARARQGDAEALSQLVGLLAADDERLADRVYATLVEIGDPVADALLSQVETGDRQQREYVIAALGTLKVERAVPAISEVLETAALQRRYVAAWALGEIGDPDGIPPLVSALDADNREVRRYATRALIKFNREAVSPLLDYLPRASIRGAGGAIRALGDIADPRALDLLLDQAEGANRADAFLALGKLRDPRAEQTLLAGLQDPDWRIRMNAAMALGPLGGPQAAKALRTTLEDEVHVVREWSARSLEMITGDPVMYRNNAGDYVRSYSVYH